MIGLKEVTTILDKTLEGDFDAFIENPEVTDFLSDIEDAGIEKIKEIPTEQFMAAVSILSGTAKSKLIQMGMIQEFAVLSNFPGAIIILVGEVMKLTLGMQDIEGWK